MMRLVLWLTMATVLAIFALNGIYHALLTEMNTVWAHTATALSAVVIYSTLTGLLVNGLWAPVPHLRHARPVAAFNDAWTAPALAMMDAIRYMPRKVVEDKDDFEDVTKIIMGAGFYAFALFGVNIAYPAWSWYWAPVAALGVYALQVALALLLAPRRQARLKTT